MNSGLPPFLSHSAQIEKRFKKRFIYRRVLSLIYILATLIYLGWRLTIINQNSLTASVIYFIAELFGFILGVTAIFSSWKYTHREIPLAPAGLEVDVIIPTYKEPLAIIRQTVLAAKKISYPHNTLITDDGNRNEVKQLAIELGVSYLARQDGLNAKAGNLNFALSKTKGEFVVVFDADHIAQPHAIDVMLGSFANKKIAMVQTPQDYYNVDAFQYMNPKTKSGYWHDQSFFYNIALSNHDSYGAATCVGTGVTYRRSSLEDIGGIPIDTITEDIHTSLKLHKAGFETVFLNEPIAYGIAAADLDDYYRTRHRWGHGNLAALICEKILSCKGLSFKQRLTYLSFGLIYLEGWQQLLLLTLPILALVFGLAPFEISIFNVFVILLFPLLSYQLLQEVGCGFTRFWTNEIFSMARWPVQIQATFAVFGKNSKWNTSIKNISGKVSLRALLPQLTVSICSLLAVAYAVYRLNENFIVGPPGLALYNFFTIGTVTNIDLYSILPEGYSLELVVIASFWALFNVARGSYFITKVFKNANNSHDFYRFPIMLPIFNALKEQPIAYTTAIAEDWISIASPKLQLADIGSTLKLNILLPNSKLLALKVTIDHSSVDSLSGRIQWGSDSERDALAATLYNVDWQREIQIKNAYFNTLYDSITAIFKPKNEPVKPADWSSILIEDKTSDNHGLVAMLASRENVHSVLSFTPLKIGSIYKAQLLNNKTSITFTPISSEDLSSIPHLGLDDVCAYRFSVEIN